MTTKQQIANAIKWIDALDPKSGFKKTVAKLGNGDPDNPRYCCLGVACKVLDKPNINWEALVHTPLCDDLGICTSTATFIRSVEVKTDKGFKMKASSLTLLNDSVYPHDNDFKNIHEFILSHLDIVFIKGVAEGLKEHYNK